MPSDTPDFYLIGNYINIYYIRTYKYLFMHLINDNIHKLKALCKKYKVSKLYVFGSILTSRFNDDSDVDLLVNFTPEIDHNNYADNFLDFYHSLKMLFGREVDLVEETAIRNPFFKEELEETKHLIYG